MGSLKAFKTFNSNKRMIRKTVGEKGQVLVVFINVPLSLPLTWALFSLCGTTEATENGNILVKKKKMEGNKHIIIRRIFMCSNKNMLLRCPACLGNCGSKVQTRAPKDVLGLTNGGRFKDVKWHSRLHL